MRRYYIISFCYLSVNIFGLADLWAKDASFLKQAKEYRNIGYLAYLQGDLEKAYQFFKKSVYLNPQYAVVHNDLGIIYEKRGFRELAEKEYLEAIRLDPGYAPPYMNLALLYKASGDKEKTALYLKERARLGRKKDPWRQKAERLLTEYGYSPKSSGRIKQEGEARRVEAVGLMEEAREELLVGSKDKASAAQGYLISGKRHYADGNYSQALADFKKAEEFAPVTPVVENYIRECEEKAYIERLYVEGKTALNNGDFLLAINKISQLIMLNPMYKDAGELLVSAEKEKFVRETAPEEPIIVHIP